MNQAWLFSFASVTMLLQLISAQPEIFPTAARLSTTWINSESTLRLRNLSDGSKARFILGRLYYPDYACGFYCNGTCDTYMFAIVTSFNNGSAAVVWSANRNNPVELNATLQLTSKGDVVLRDVDGTLVWSTNTSHKSVVGLNMTESGNLVLFDAKNSIVWQSFDHPTDTLLQGQRLLSRQELISSVSDANRTQGQYFLSITNDGLSAFIESNPPQVYATLQIFERKKSNEASYVEFRNGSLALFISSVEPDYPDRSIIFTWTNSPQYMRLMPDGHLNVYKLGDDSKLVADLLEIEGTINECAYPMVCGKHGICSQGQCSCPISSTDPTNFFNQFNERHPDHGCYAVTPLTCDASHHKFIELEDVTCFNFNSHITDVDIGHCREACLKNCSCKAAFFRYYDDTSVGDCYLPSEIFSLMDNAKVVTFSNNSAFIKVQIAPSPPAPSISKSPSAISAKNSSNLQAILGSTIGGFFLLVITIGVTIFIIKKKENASEEEEYYLDYETGVLSRFSHEDMKIATENFSKKLGEGGFGSVFEGALKDGTKIAVKCLNGIGQVKKSFLAEVESIGSIHHVKLVRLIGFCAEKSQKLLVYEHMANGSLDRWIYRRNQGIILDWKCRRKIIQDVAKGVAYLHEDCRQKIIHLDIKPQNILLDENYNAKLSDFGLSKLIDRDQSQVVTTMRGTPGYLAPEWLSASITEKVDVYSFGVVVLEIICGRKIFEISEPEECRYLLDLFKIKAEEERLFDLIDKRSEDMQSQGIKVVEMMQIAAWCLQSDHAKRPSMSMVVKVLEDGMDVEKNLNYGSLNSQASATNGNCYVDATPLLPSILSGPR